MKTFKLIFHLVLTVFMIYYIFNDMQYATFYLGLLILNNQK